MKKALKFMKFTSWKLLIAILEIFNSLIIIFSIGFISPHLVLRLVKWKANRYIMKGKKLKRKIY